MQQELRFATFNVCNLALPGVRYYDDQEPYSAAEYDAKIAWIARQLDRLDADVIGFQDIFSHPALLDVLARTGKYQHAHHVCFASDGLARPTPHVALVSRFPIAPGATFHLALPRNLSVELPGIGDRQTGFTRPVLQARVVFSEQCAIECFVCHLKSRRPDYRNGAAEGDSDHLGIATLRSLIRRGADALGLRLLLTDCMNATPAPLLVMGDFNDIAAAVSTQLVVRAGQTGDNGSGPRLFDSYRIQARRDPVRDVGYTHVHEGNYETVDHVLVSREFNPESGLAIGEVSEVIYLNDHIGLQQPGASDHGMVLVRITLNDQCVDQPAAASDI